MLPMAIDTSSSRSILLDLDAELVRQRKHQEDANRRFENAVPDLQILQKIEEEMNKQSTRLHNMQLELYQQSADVQTLKRITDVSRLQLQLQTQTTTMREQSAVIENVMHEHLMNHASAQRVQLEHMQELIKQQKSDMIELVEDTSTEVQFLPVKHDDLTVLRVDFSTESMIPNVPASRTIWMISNNLELLVVVGDGTNTPRDHGEIARQLVAYLKIRREDVPFAIFVPHGRQGTGFLPWFEVISSEFGKTLPFIVTDDDAFDEFAEQLEGPDGLHHRHPIHQGFVVDEETHEEAVRRTLHEAVRFMKLLPTPEIQFPSGQNVSIQTDDDDSTSISLRLTDGTLLVKVSGAQQPSQEIESKDIEQQKIGYIPTTIAVQTPAKALSEQSRDLALNLSLTCYDEQSKVLFYNSALEHDPEEFRGLDRIRVFHEHLFATFTELGGHRDSKYIIKNRCFPDGEFPVGLSFSVYTSEAAGIIAGSDIMIFDRISGLIRKRFIVHAQPRAVAMNAGSQNGSNGSVIHSNVGPSLQSLLASYDAAQGSKDTETFVSCYSEQATIIVCQATPLMDPLQFSGLSGVEGFAEWYMEHTPNEIQRSIIHVDESDDDSSFRTVYFLWHSEEVEVSMAVELMVFSSNKILKHAVIIDFEDDSDG